MSEDRMPEGRQRAEREFTAPGPLPEGADVKDAEAKLLGALERELGVSLATPVVRPARPRRWRPLLSIAAVLLAAAGLLWSQDALRRKREGELLRGAPPVEAPGAWGAHLHAQRMSEGNARLAWAPAPGATSYDVVFLAPDLSEVARVDSVTATQLDLDAARLPHGLAPGQAVLWRVIARAGRDEIARSPAAPYTP